MLLPNLYWPLEMNVIRKNSVANTFGLVRNGGQRPHQGWDLLATLGTRCYAVADGKVVWADPHGQYGKLLLIEFEHRGRTLYAAYAHMSQCAVFRGRSVAGGDFIGMTGNTGNAESMQGDDQHLHFEIRTVKFPGQGLGGRLNPREVYGFTPLHTVVYDSRPPASQLLGMGAPGLKVRGVNLL